MDDISSQLLIKDPEKTAKSLVKKLTHSGEDDLDKDLLNELKSICKAIRNDQIIILIYKECLKHLHKEHSQIRVASFKLIDYLFHKSHAFREKLLDDFDVLLELTLAISQKPKIKITLPPPKKFAHLLQELAAKSIHKWHAEYACGYEKLRYAYRFLREHKLVDFSQFRVHNHEEQIKRQRLMEQQEKILTRTIENRMREFRQLKPDIEQTLAQIESLISLLIPSDDNLIEPIDEPNTEESREDSTSKQHYGIANISQSIEIEFSPYLEIQKTSDNKDIVQNLKESKRQLAENKLNKLINIEKIFSRRSDQLVGSLKEIIDLKSKSMSLVFKLSELKIVNDSEEASGSKKRSSTLNDVESESDEDDSNFEEVQPKEDLESYIPKSLRYEYGLVEAIDPKELSNSNKISLTEESFNTNQASSGSNSNNSSESISIACGFRLESGKLCPRRDKVKCPFHGRIIPRDHLGTPLNEDDRLQEKMKSKSKVPDWQDPQLLLEIKYATGVDLTMPKRGKASSSSLKKLYNPKTCDLTAKQRLEKRLRTLTK